MIQKTFHPDITVANIESTLKEGLANSLDLHFTEVGADYLKAELKVSKKHLRPGGIMNGGVSLAIIETVGSVAGRSMLHPQPKNSLGIQVNASHLRVANLGDILTAKATPLHIGKTTHIWDVNITNQNNALVSNGRITLLVTDALPK